MQHSSIFNHVITVGNENIKLEHGKMSTSSDASITLYCRDTVILVNLVCGHLDAHAPLSQLGEFIPFSVHYTERFYANNKIPHTFNRRENRNTEHEILMSRLIDRCIRSILPMDLAIETTMTLHVLSFDPNTDLEILSIIAAMVTILFSGLPYRDILAPVKLEYQNEVWQLSNNFGNGLNNTGGGKKQNNGNPSILFAFDQQGLAMVDSSGLLTPAAILQATEIARGHAQDLHKQIAQSLEIFPTIKHNMLGEMLKMQAESKVLVQKCIQEFIAKHTEKIISNTWTENKQLRNQGKMNLYKIAQEMFLAYHFANNILHYIVNNAQKSVLRDHALQMQKRIDGRKFDELRPLSSQMHTLPKPHGSAIFARGKTKVMAVVTMGNGDDEYLMDSLAADQKQNFILQYNFHNFATNDSLKSSVSRREIGHGRLVYKAIAPILPKRKDYGQCLRIVNEVLESNGSSSMASVCATTLALLDASVPLNQIVGGIAMGLISSPSRDYAILTDILGIEDGLGEVDCKIAAIPQGISQGTGTHGEITTIQMDSKTGGITLEIWQELLSAGQKAIGSILQHMQSTISQHSVPEALNTVNNTTMMTINKANNGLVIGSGGKVIKELSEIFGAKIDVKDGGQIYLTALRPETADLTDVKNCIKAILIGGHELNIVYYARVMNIEGSKVYLRFIGTGAEAVIQEQVHNFLQSDGQNQPQYTKDQILRVIPKAYNNGKFSVNVISE